MQSQQGYMHCSFQMLCLHMLHAWSSRRATQRFVLPSDGVLLQFLCSLSNSEPDLLRSTAAMHERSAVIRVASFVRSGEHMPMHIQLCTAVILGCAGMAQSLACGCFEAQHCRAAARSCLGCSLSTSWCVAKQACCMC